MITHLSIPTNELLPSKRIFRGMEWNDVSERIHSVNNQEVKRVLNQKNLLSTEDFLVLVSPAAAPYLEQMVAKSAALTRKRFGNTMQLYAPLYLSNECRNICTYCGFSVTNQTPRKTLTDAEIIQEAQALKKHGFEHVLLVTGEAGKTVGLDYMSHAIDLLKPHFAQISIEVQPLEEDEYRLLHQKGLHAVLVYQETYRKETYRQYHPKGKKANYEYRLDTPDRLGRAGIHKIGLGVLLGLEDWRVDSVFAATHLDYLQRRYWQSRYSISFPRMRPFEGGEFDVFPMSERELLQLISAWRLFREDVELSLSTRERAYFRNHACKLGITSMSAGSRTEPGGYSQPDVALEQFEIDDNRSPKEIAEMLRSQQMDVIWKDWDPYLQC
jgi:2-iminoacetate synthase